MQLKNTLTIAAILGFQFVYAEVEWMTPGLPTPTATPSFKDKADSESWDAVISTAIDNRLAIYAMDQPSSWATVIMSAAVEFDNFLATATVSIPEDVTAIGVTTTITAVPEWYTAVPEDLRMLQESLQSVFASFSSEEVAKACETMSARVKCYANDAENESKATKLRSAAGMGAAVALAVLVGSVMLLW